MGHQAGRPACQHWAQKLIFLGANLTFRPRGESAIAASCLGYSLKDRQGRPLLPARKKGAPKGSELVLPEGHCFQPFGESYSKRLLALNEDVG